MKTKTSTYALRLPISLKSALKFFEGRRAQGDRKAFRRILKRKGGEAPQAGDEAV
ncbi:MAG: hypothetical protein HZB13_11455 [Acidobacteria bacterium]|nr:hypothetical protein [Acidobacteriota bacterium]